MMMAAAAVVGVDLLLIAVFHGPSVVVRSEFDRAANDRLIVIG
jgi:hypothetical protein